MSWVLLQEFLKQAAKMSLTRSRQALTDTNALLVDFATHRWPNAARGTQIDVAAKEILQPQLESHEPEISCRTIELNQ